MSDLRIVVMFVVAVFLIAATVALVVKWWGDNDHR